jgi:hypothetical protein
MKENAETLMKFDGFSAWGWDTEFREALAAHRPDASYDGTVADQMRLDIVRQFVEFICEVINQEFRLGLMVEVESAGPNYIVGFADFGEDRRAAITKVEDRAFAGNRTVPDICKDGAPILDRLLTCTEIVLSPGRLHVSLGEFKDECIARTRNDGSISSSIRAANPDGTNAYYSYLAASVGRKP